MPRAFLAVLLMLSFSCGHGGGDAAPAPAAPAPVAVQAPAIKDTTPTTVVHVDTVRIRPRDFLGLPASVADWLEAHGYTIPQAEFPSEPNNVTRGAFTAPGQEDWAVLAYKPDSLVLIVFEESRGYRPQIVDSDEYYYSPEVERLLIEYCIGTADSEYIRNCFEAFGGRTPPHVLNHEGINYAYIDKGSSIAYFYEGEWVWLQGGD